MIIILFFILYSHMKRKINESVDNTKYWIYVMDKKYWDEYMTYVKNNKKNLCIGLVYDNPLDTKNIIIIYVKGNGFTGLCISNGTYIKNTNINIFQDLNLQKYVLKVQHFSILKNVSTANNIKNIITNANFKSIQWFSSVYAKKNHILTKMENTIARDLIIAIQHNNKIIDYNTIYSNKNTHDHDTDDSDIDSENDTDSNTNSGSDSDTDDSENSSDTDSKNSDDSENSSDTDDSENSSDADSKNSDDCSSNSDNESDCSFNYESEVEEEHKNGHVPVKIKLCSDFLLPNLKNNDSDEDDDIDENGNTKDDNLKCKYILSHINKCKKCKLLNNDRSNYLKFIEDAIVNFEHINENNIEYKTILDYYYNAKRYNPFGELEKSITKIYYLNDDDSIHNNSLFATWYSPDE